LQPALMTAPEIEWLDAYHALVSRTVGPLLGDAERSWLEAACAPLIAR
jgi:Xaa-Pro aminopeptidase